MFPPLNYRTPRDDEREYAASRKQAGSVVYDLFSGFFKPILGILLMFFLVLAGMGKDLWGWAGYAPVLLGLATLLTWLTIRQIPDRTHGYRTGLIWGGVVGMLIFLMLGSRFL